MEIKNKLQWSLNIFKITQTIREETCQFPKNGMDKTSTNFTMSLINKDIKGKRDLCKLPKTVDVVFLCSFPTIVGDPLGDGGERRDRFHLPRGIGSCRGSSNVD